MRSSLIFGTLVFCFINNCAAQPNITIVGATMGLGTAGYDELSRFKSSSLRKKLLDAIDSGQMSVNDWVPADTNNPQRPITALCAATITGNVQTIEELFKRGANPNLSCVSGGRPFVLDVIVQKDRKTSWNPDETIAVLLRHGAKLNKPENQARLDRRLQEIQDEAAKAEEDKRQTAANISGVISILGATATNYAALKTREQATPSLGNNVLADSQRAADSMRANTERRAIESRLQLQSQAAALQQTQALAAQERAQLQAAQQANLSSRPTTTTKQQATLDAIAAAPPAPQTVVIPTWNEGPRKTMEPVRTEPAPLVASKLSAGQMGGNPCGQSGDVINECSKTPQTCPVGQSLVSGQCVVPTISCIAPAVLVQGSCVSPNTNAGNNITNAPAPNQTRPAPVAPTTVRIAPAPAPVRPVPAPPTTASESPEPANPIIVTREQRDGYAIVKMTNVSPRINWNVAMNIFNCVNVKSPATSCGRHVFIATLGPQGGFANNIIDAENKSMEFSYEISVDWGKSAY